MLKVYRLNDGTYLMTNESRRFCVSGNVDKMIHALRCEGIEDSEIEFCLTELVKHDAQVGYFGINGLYTHHAWLKDGKAC